MSLARSITRVYRHRTSASVSILAGALFCVSALLPATPLAAAVSAPVPAPSVASENKNQTEIVVYQQGPSIYDQLFREFEREHPDIRVVVRSGRYELGGTIDAELDSGRVQADLVILQTLLDFDRWNARGALSPYRPPGYAFVREELKIPEGGAMPFAFTLSGIGYNASKLPEKDVPRAISDFLRPEFEGKIASTYPHDDDTALWRYAQIAEAYGWPFIDRLLAQGIHFERSHAALGRAVDSGAWPVTLEQVKIFSRSEFVAPQDFPLLVIPINIALMSDAPHPETSKLLLDFLFSRSAQQSLLGLNFFPSRADVVLPPDLQDLMSGPLDFGYLAFLRNNDRLTLYKTRFHELIGDPQGDYATSIGEAK